ncbi:MAG: hypothetical protein H0U36_02370 [Nocardioidaceae bacterium]|nr:hypothetical protein [Nocardioidaceae bacterium]
MQVLWWLVPPLAATVLAMLWAAWLGRQRDDDRRDDSDAALAKMADALARPAPRRARLQSPPAAVAEPGHGVAVRRTPRRPASPGSTTR